MASVSSEMAAEGASRLSAYLYIAGCIAFTVYGQLILKWRVGQVGAMPGTVAGKFTFAGHLLSDPWVISGLVGAFLAFLCWMGALSMLDLTYAYPFTSLSFVLVLILGAALFREHVSAGKVVAVLMICGGLVVGSRWP
jgi:drug/metabolite transporter (DMT)-like permease